MKAKEVLDKVGRNLSAAYTWSKGLDFYDFRTATNPNWGAAYFANYGFVAEKGNSYVKSATFFYMAKMLGYNARVLYGTLTDEEGEKNDHAWVEIRDDDISYYYDLIGTPGWKISYYTNYEKYNRYETVGIMQMEQVS